MSRIRVVLVHPQGAANVGAVARAMKNMGLSDLALVGTSQRRIAAARNTAVHAADLLQECGRYRNIEEAVADCTMVVGTSAQLGIYRDAPELPAEICPDVLANAQRGRVAILFGPEHHGLTREDLRFCQRLVRIDCSDEYTSLNLAQAVLLVCYELRRFIVAPNVSPDARIGAAAADLQRADQRMQQALIKMGFLNPQNPDRIMFVLRRMLGRAGVRPLEARILMALSRQMEWCAEAAANAKLAGLLPKRDRDHRRKD